MEYHSKPVGYLLRLVHQHKAPASVSLEQRIEHGIALIHTYYTVITVAIIGDLLFEVMHYGQVLLFSPHIAIAVNVVCIIVIAVAVIMSRKASAYTRRLINCYEQTRNRKDD